MTQVDIYGQCGDRECPRSNASECYRHVAEHYKFYLSFENSVCEDYVTEKYYNVMKHNIVPVTYNGANMSLYGPPHSSINALEYQTAEALVDFLQEVYTN
jgi:alpha-1,3-fucosyltransferase